MTTTSSLTAPRTARRVIQRRDLVRSRKQKRRQSSDIRRNPPRLILVKQLGCRIVAPAQFWHAKSTNCPGKARFHPPHRVSVSHTLTRRWDGATSTAYAP